jgi:predicted kinase
MIAAASEQVDLSAADLERLEVETDANPVTDYESWAARECRNYARHECPPKVEDLDAPLYLEPGDMVEKFREDQLREPSGSSEGGRFAREGGGSVAGDRAGRSSREASNAALRARGWTNDRFDGVDNEYVHGDYPGETVVVHQDGAWAHYRPTDFTTDTVRDVIPGGEGKTSRELYRHLGGESDALIPHAPEDDRLPGARTQQPADALVTPEHTAWLEEIEKDPDVARGLENERTGTSTHLLHSDGKGNYTPERRALHDTISEEMLKPGAARAPGQRKTAILMLGKGGAGKTTTLGLVLRKPEQFSIISADYAKEKIPEYDGYNSGVVHEESTEIAEHNALLKALHRQHNIVLDATGKTSSKYEVIAEKLHRLGYAVQALHVDVPTIVSAQRAVSRFKDMKADGQIPRFSNPRRILYDTDDKPATTYANLKARGLLSRAMEFNSNGPPGTPPRKVEDIDFTAHRVGKAAAPGRDDAPGGAHRGGDAQDAGRGAGGDGGAVAADAAALSALVASAVAKALADRDMVPAVALEARRVKRTVEKQVVRDANNRIDKVIETTLEEEI